MMSLEMLFLIIRMNELGANGAANQQQRTLSDAHIAVLEFVVHRQIGGKYLPLANFALNCLGRSNCFLGDLVLVVKMPLKTSRMQLFHAYLASGLDAMN